MLDPVRLYALAHDALMAVRDEMGKVYGDPRYLHDRHGVVNGPPALDGWVDAGGCAEQLVAWVEGIVPTDSFPVPSQRRVMCAPPNSAITLVVQTIRCEPTLHDEGGEVAFPSMTELDDAARMVTTDAWIMWQALSCWGLALEDVDFYIVGGSPVPAQGMVAGWEMRVQVEGGDACCPLPETWPPFPEAFLPDP